MNGLRAAVDEHYFRPEGDYEVLGSKQTLGSFIVEWKEHYAKVHDLDFASITPMLRHRPYLRLVHARVPPERVAADRALEALLAEV
jgi:hypothetical protein